MSRNMQDDSIFDIFLEFSRTSPNKFSGESDCRTRWESFGNNAANPVGVGTLRWMAEQDSPTEYATIFNSRLAPVAVSTLRNITDEEAVALQSALAIPASVQNWRCEPADAGGLKMTPLNCTTCLADPSAHHSHSPHSCMFVNVNKVCISCFTHGKRNITGKQLKKLLQVLRPILGDSWPAAPEEKRDDDEPRHTNAEIAEIILENNRAFALSFRHVPGMQRSATVTTGLYFNNPMTHIWSLLTAIEMEQLVLGSARILHEQKMLNKRDREYIENAGMAPIIHALARNKIDKGLERKLDENLDIFAVNNGVFDMVSKEFRAACREDYVMTTAGWEYSPEEAAVHRGELETFLEQVLPVEEERIVALKFFASSLSGRRSIKRFMILTDKRDGNNGKSALMQLISGFFGKFNAKKGTDIVCKSTMARNRNDHDAGLQCLKTSRLIVADEFQKTDILDTAFIKRYISGAGATAGGRKLGSEAEFDFTWKANFVLLWNQGCAPKMDTDGAFFERQLVVPMRSRFEVGDQQSVQEYTFPVDINISRRFPLWYSALAELLVSLYDEGETLSNIPQSMVSWRADVADEANPLAPWLDACLIKTGKKDDVFVFSSAITGDQKGLPNPRPGEVITFVKAYCKSHGITFKASWTDHEQGTSKRNVAFGVLWDEYAAANYGTVDE